MAALLAIARKVDPASADPGALYEWLCHFTHLNAKGLSKVYLATEEHRLGFREDSARGLAYVSWALTEVTLLVTGIPRNPTWPSRSGASCGFCHSHG